MTSADRTEDAILGGRLRLHQPRHGYRVAIDPVLLAAAVPARPGERVLDAGAGSGAAALCLAHRCPEVHVVGLERDAELLALARENAAGNTAGARVEMVAGDLAAPFRGEAFDHVMTNPPFHRRGRATAPAQATAAAAHLTEMDVGAWVGACMARLRPRGRLTLIHRPEALPELLAALLGRAGDILVYPLWPTESAAAARRLIVSARAGIGGPARLARGLALHGPDGRYTATAEGVLRDGAALDLQPVGDR